jgi:hypothetical protein
MEERFRSSAQPGLLPLAYRCGLLALKQYEIEYFLAGNDTLLSLPVMRGTGIEFFPP